MPGLDMCVDMALPWILPLLCSNGLGFSKNHETLSLGPPRWLKDSRVGAQQPVLDPLTWQRPCYLALSCNLLTPGTFG